MLTARSLTEQSDKYQVFLIFSTIFTYSGGHSATSLAEPSAVSRFTHKNIEGVIAQKTITPSFIKLLAERVGFATTVSLLLNTHTKNF